MTCHTVPAYCSGVTELPQHHPFRELRTREHITFVFTDLADRLGGAFYARKGRRALIGVSKSLGRRERSAAVAHEIGHDDLGEHEGRVQDFVARWLVPLDELAQLVASICDDGSSVMAWEIAEAFDVPEDVAVRACELLRKKGAA